MAYHPYTKWSQIVQAKTPMDKSTKLQFLGETPLVEDHERELLTDIMVSNDESTNALSRESGRAGDFVAVLYGSRNMVFAI
jgi:hypothetical protein